MVSPAESTVTTSVTRIFFIRALCIIHAFQRPQEAPGCVSGAPSDPSVTLNHPYAQNNPPEAASEPPEAPRYVRYKHTQIGACRRHLNARRVGLPAPPAAGERAPRILWML